MTWRSIVVSTPAVLRYRQGRLLVQQPPAEAAVPLEDIAVLLLESPEILLSSRLLQECVDAGVTVLTVGRDHHPNGALLPFLPHSRPLKLLHRQLNASQPQRKRLWQRIVRQKVINQARGLELLGKAGASRLTRLAATVKSGDPENVEAMAARLYFRALYGPSFSRSQESLLNAALNYGYAVLRAAIARSLTLHGFLPVLGLHHRNEQNAFNLADDLIEPYRPVVDLFVSQTGAVFFEDRLTPPLKAGLVSVLHHDVAMPSGEQSVLAAIEASVMSLGRSLSQGKAEILDMPTLLPLCWRSAE